MADGLYNYTLHEEIGRGGTSVVYLATSGRGRMRNRLVALKKVTRTRDIPTAQPTSSTALHQSLYHPSIASLLSAFTAGSVQYHILELCINGSLQDVLLSRGSHALCENELRGVVKGLVDALIYLRKERVIHCDIKPSNILLSESSRVKLSDFRLSVRVPTEASTLVGFQGSSKYISPEIVAHSPHGFATDLWSLGSVMVTCLSGKPAFDAPSIDEIYENISNACYELPATSREVADIILGLLQIDPDDRIPLHEIPCHPFLDPSLPVKPLTSSSDPKSTVYSRPPPVTTACDSARNEPPIAGHQYSISSHEEEASLSEPSADIDCDVTPQPRAPLRHRRSFGHFSTLDNAWKSSGTSSTLPLSGRHLSSATPQSRILSASSFTSLGRQLAGADPASDSVSLLPGRRISSAPSFGISSTPVPAQLLRHASKPGSGSGSGTPALTYSESMVSDCILEDALSGVDVDLPSASQPLLLPPSRFKKDISSLRDKIAAREIEKRKTKDSVHHNEDGPFSDAWEEVGHRDAEFLEHANKGSGRDKPATPAAAPIGTTRPVAFNTTYLVPQTRKVVKGQVTILPSRSLLVDFREGDRRKGQKGNEVLLISSDGIELEVYSAPHLSTPCCLAEPLTTYPLEQLPQSYWKAYNDASRIVDEMKQRIPKLVLYRPDAQCTLMANEPSGDIELTLPSPGPTVSAKQTKKTQRSDSETTPTVSMRIRLLRQRRTVEIARYASLRGGATTGGTGEWVKKILPTLGKPLRVDEDEWQRLDAPEQTGLSLLWDFVRICEAVDEAELSSVHSTNVNTLSSRGAPAHSTNSPSMRPKSVLVSPPETGCCSTIPAMPSGRTHAHAGRGSAPAASSHGSGPRTCSPSATTSTLPSLSVAPRPAKFANTTSSCGNSHTITSRATAATSASYSEVLSVPPLTRYVPSIGWCTRYKVAGAVRYKLLFSDGGSVEVDSHESARAGHSEEFDSSCSADGAIEAARRLGAVRSVFADVEGVGCFS